MAIRQQIINKTLALTYPLFYFGHWFDKEMNCEVDGAKFRTRVWTSDRQVLSEVVGGKSYTSGSEFQINDEDDVIDVGGNIGAFTVFAAKKARQVFVYEALKENYRLLMANIRLNELTNVRAYNLAVAGRVGEIEFYPENWNFGGSTIYGNSHSRSKITVPTTTLEEIFEVNKLKRVSFVKIDAEGSEYNILLNASASTLGRVERIVLEYHDFLNLNHNYKELVRKLEASGFDTRAPQSIISRLFKIGMIRAVRKV